MKAHLGIKFETTLGYVELPYWKPTTKGGHQSNAPDAIDVEVEGHSEDNPDPYVAIFDWLWSSDVAKIFMVNVDDDGEQPHTNWAIRQCLNGEDSKGQPTRNFEVEIWKWKKSDLCSDTIFRAAPAAQEVYLYSHGNTAVLRSWACKGGIAKLEKVS